MMRLAKLAPVALRGPRPLPLLGTMGSFVRFFGDPVAQLLSIHREHGVLATLADRDPAVVCAFSPEHNRAVLHDTLRFTNEADLPINVPPDSAPTRLNNALISMNGELHQRHRRLMMAAFSRAVVERHGPAMVAATEACLGHLHAGTTVDISREMVGVSLRIAMKCLFGLDAGDRTDAMGRLALGYLTGLTSPASILFPFPIPGTPYRRFLDVSDELERLMRALIAERRAQPAGGEDVLSILIRARDDQTGAGLTDSELVGQAAVLFVAGHETTAFSLSWALFLLAQHPEVLRDVVDELDAVLGGAPPTVDKLSALPHLDRAVKESMRLIPATAFLFFRRATEAFSLGGHDLPAGAIVLLSSLVTHRMPSLYPEPRCFLPDRWKGPSPAPYTYMPFGAGPRACIGATFAAQSVRLVLATMLPRFGLALAKGAKISRKMQGITLGPRYGIPMRLLRAGERAAAVKVTGDIGDLVELSG